jgi:hypothetical protein
MKSSRFSLFFVKKRAFKVFKKEAKQDLYSSKTLLNTIFSDVNVFDKNEFFFNNTKSFLEKPHKSFWSDYFLNNFKYVKEFPTNEIRFYYYCIDCGIFLA